MAQCTCAKWEQNGQNLYESLFDYGGDTLSNCPWCGKGLFNITSGKVETQGVSLLNDPFEILLEVVKEMYPDLRAAIQFDPSMEGDAGNTLFPDDGGTPVISVNATIPYMAAVEIVAHEIAHVVVGPNKDDDHGPEWDKVFSDLHQRHNSYTVEKAQRQGCGVTATEIELESPGSSAE